MDRTPDSPVDVAQKAALHEASCTALARLRYLLQTQASPHLDVFADYDEAVAAILGIPAQDAPAASGTRPQPTPEEEEFDALLAASSLGTTPPLTPQDRTPTLQATARRMLASMLTAPDAAQERAALLRAAPGAHARPLLVELYALLREADQDGDTPA